MILIVLSIMRPDFNWVLSNIKTFIRTEVNKITSMLIFFLNTDRKSHRIPLKSELCNIVLLWSKVFISSILFPMFKIWKISFLYLRALRISGQTFPRYIGSMMLSMCFHSRSNWGFCQDQFQSLQQPLSLAVLGTNLYTVVSLGTSLHRA